MAQNAIQQQTVQSLGNFLTPEDTNYAPGIRISGEITFTTDTEVTFRFTDTTTTTNKGQLKFAENGEWTSELTFTKDVKLDTTHYGIEIMINNADSFYQVGDVVRWKYTYNNRSYKHMDTIQRVDDYDLFGYSATGDGRIHCIQNANSEQSVIKELGMVSGQTGKVVTDTHGQQMYWGFGADSNAPPKWSGYPQHTQFEKQNTGSIQFEDGAIDLLGPYDNLHDFCVVRFYDHYGGGNTSATAGAGVVRHWGFGIEKGKKVLHVFYNNNYRNNSAPTDKTERYGAWIHIKSYQGADLGLEGTQSITTDGRNLFILDNVAMGIVKILEPTFKKSTSGNSEGLPWSKAGGVNGNAMYSMSHLKDFEMPNPEDSNTSAMQGAYWSCIRVNHWHDPKETNDNAQAQNESKMDATDTGYVTNGNFINDVYYDDKIWISRYRQMQLNSFITRDSADSLIYLGGLSNHYTEDVALDTQAGKVHIVSYMPNLGNQVCFKSKFGRSPDSSMMEEWYYQAATGYMGKVGVLEAYEQPFVNLNKSGVMGFVMSTGLWESGGDRGSPNSNFAQGIWHENLGADNLRHLWDGLAGGGSYGSAEGSDFSGLDPAPNCAETYVTTQNCALKKGVMLPAEQNYWGQDYDLDGDSGDASNQKVYHFYGDGIKGIGTMVANHATSWEDIANPFPMQTAGRFAYGPNYIHASEQTTHWHFIMRNPQTQLYVVHSHRANTANSGGQSSEDGFMKEALLCPSGTHGQKTLQFPILEPKVKWTDAGTEISNYQSGFQSAHFIETNPLNQNAGSKAHYLYVSCNIIGEETDADSRIYRSVDLSNVDFRNPQDRSIFTAGYGKARKVTNANTVQANVNEPMLFSSGAGDDIIRTGAADKGTTNATYYQTPKDYILGSRTSGFTIGAKPEDTADSCPWYHGNETALGVGTGLYNGGMFIFEVWDGYPSTTNNQIFPREGDIEMVGSNGICVPPGKRDDLSNHLDSYHRSWVINLQVLAYDAVAESTSPYRIADHFPTTKAVWGGSSYSYNETKLNYLDVEENTYIQSTENLVLISANKGEINTMPAFDTDGVFKISTVSKEASYSASLSQLNEDGWEWAVNEKAWYKISFMYDGFQESPLSALLDDPHTITTPGGGEDGSRIKITIKLSKEATDVMNRRISHVQLYRSIGSNSDTDAPEFYRLVKSIPLTTSEWTYVDPHWTKDIYDKKDMFASYEELTGMPETLDNTQLHYGVSANQSGYLFVTSCWHKETGGLPNYIFRSKPGKYNIFDWSADYAVLPEKPIALAGFAGKIWAWSKNTMYRINPANLVLEDIFEGIGCYSENSVVVTDYGMFWADDNMIYRHDGSRSMNIGSPIVAGDKHWSWRAKSNAYSPLLAFDYANKQLLCTFKPNKALGANGCYAWAYHVDRNRWDLYDFEQRIAGVSQDIDVLSLDNADDGSIIFSTQGMGVQKFRGGQSKRRWQYLSKSITCDTPTLKKVFYKLRIKVLEGIVSRLYQFDQNAQSSMLMIDKDSLDNNTYEKFLVGGSNDPNRKARSLQFKIYGGIGSIVDSVGTIFRRTGMPK